MTDRPTLTSEERMKCKCGSDMFHLSIGLDEVICVLCDKPYHLAQHLFSGSAESCGMMYPYEQDPNDKEWYFNKTIGCQDWTEPRAYPLSASGYNGYADSF